MFCVLVTNKKKLQKKVTCDEDNEREGITREWRPFPCCLWRLPSFSATSLPYPCCRFYHFLIFFIFVTYLLLWRLPSFSATSLPRSSSVRVHVLFVKCGFANCKSIFNIFCPLTFFVLPFRIQTLLSFHRWLEKSNLIWSFEYTSVCVTTAHFKFRDITVRCVYLNIESIIHLTYPRNNPSVLITLKL